jgi:hypothetical protein
MDILPEKSNTILQSSVEFAKLSKNPIAQFDPIFTCRSNLYSNCKGQISFAEKKWPRG